MLFGFIVLWQMRVYYIDLTMTCLSERSLPSSPPHRSSLSSVYFLEPLWNHVFCISGQTPRSDWKQANKHTPELHFLQLSAGHYTKPGRQATRRGERTLKKRMFVLVQSKTQKITLHHTHVCHAKLCFLDEMWRVERIKLSKHGVDSLRSFRLPLQPAELRCEGWRGHSTSALFN